MKVFILNFLNVVLITFKYKTLYNLKNTNKLRAMQDIELIQDIRHEFMTILESNSDNERALTLANEMVKSMLDKMQDQKIEPHKLEGISKLYYGK